MDKWPVSNLSSKAGFSHHLQKLLLYMSVCLCEGRYDRYRRRYWHWRTWKTWKSFLGIQCTCSSLRRTDVNLLSDAGHGRKWELKAINFLQKERFEKVLRIKILAKPHKEDPKLFSKWLFLAELITKLSTTWKFCGVFCWRFLRNDLPKFLVTFPLPLTWVAHFWLE